MGKPGWLSPDGVADGPGGLVAVALGTPVLVAVALGPIVRVAVTLGKDVLVAVGLASDEISTRSCGFWSLSSRDARLIACWSIPSTAKLTIPSPLRSDATSIETQLLAGNPFILPICSPGAG